MEESKNRMKERNNNDNKRWFKNNKLTDDGMADLVNKTNVISIPALKDYSNSEEERVYFSNNNVNRKISRQNNSKPMQGSSLKNSLS